MESDNPLHPGGTAVPNTRQVSESVQQGPEEEFLELEFASEEGKSKLFDLLNLHPKNEAENIIVQRIIRVISVAGFINFRDIMNISDMEEIHNLRKGEKYPPVISARLNTLHQKLQQQSLQPKHARTSGIGAASVTTNTSPIIHATQIVDEVTSYIESQFEGRKLEDIKLEEFEFPDELAHLRTDLPIFVRPDSSSKYPCLLLSGLPDHGEEFDKLESEIVNSISKHNAALFGVSGIGKTRRLYQMMCKHYGFLFLCGFSDYEKASPNPGARDFAKCLSDIETFVETHNHDVKYVPGFIKSAAAARMLIFCIAMKQWPEMTPKQWLFVQLFPEHYFSVDIFLAAYRRVVQRLKKPTLEQVEDILKTATEFVENVWKNLSQPENGLGMLCFVDEAQKLHGKLSGRFKSEQILDEKHRKQYLQRTYGEHRKTRDLLSCVAKSFNAVQESKVMCSALLTGTGFRMQQNADAIDNAAGKRKSDDLKTQFSSLFPLTIEKVKDYIGTYVATDEIEEFVLTHVANWLTGRPRWTASFVEDWLMKRKASFKFQTTVPNNDALRQGFFSDAMWNKLIQDHVESAWLFCYVDDYVTKLTKRQDDDVEARKSGYIEVPASLIRKFCGHAIFHEKLLLIQEFKTGVFEYTLRGRDVVSLPLHSDDMSDVSPMEYVELGVCCVSQKHLYKSTILEQAELCEPLIVEAAIKFFGIGQICINAFRNTISSKSKSAGGKLFEHNCLPILNGLFNNAPIQDHPILQGVAVSEQFAGSWRLPCSSYGVFISIPIENEYDEDVIVNYAEQLCNRVVFEGQLSPAITTDTSFGGGLFGHVCCADLDGIAWCFMNLQCKFRDNKKKTKKMFTKSKKVPGDSLDASTLHAAHLTVIPEMIWHRKRVSHPEKVETRKIQFDKLLELVRNHGGLFRVILMYPANLPEEHNVQNGGVSYPKGSYKYDIKDTARTDQGNHDFLLVVHGGNIEQVLTSCYTGEEVREYIENLVAYKKALS